MSRFDAVVFDLDGVLVDSDHIWHEVREGLARERGGHWTDQSEADMSGMSSLEWSQYLHDAVGLPESPQELNDEVVRRMVARYGEEPPFIDGAREAVTRLAGSLRLAVASSSNRELIESVLEAGGILAHFDAWVSSEEVPRGKPAPDVFLEAARRIGVDPARCVAIEDSTKGLRAAHAAGMRLVAVPNRRYPPAGEAVALADVVVESIAGLSAEVVAG